MPVSLKYATDSVASWDVVTAFETRIVAVLAAAGKPAQGYVRITGDPDAGEAGGYKGEEGVHIVVGDPQPVVNDGASRYGQRVRRVMQVWLYTTSNRDRAGEQRLATQRHLTVEDYIVNGMSGTPPNTGAPTWNLPVGITLKWIPGGEEIKRAKGKDVSRFVSVHLFEVVYPQYMQASLA